MQKQVEELVALGALPDENADEKLISKFEFAIAAISTPVTDEEAKLLLTCFGDGDSFGLAFALLHIIETAQVYPLVSAPAADENKWLQLIWRRGANVRNSQ